MIGRGARVPPENPSGVTMAWFGFQKSPENQGYMWGRNLLGDREEEGGDVRMSAWYKSFMWMSVKEYVESSGVDYQY